MNYGRNQSHKKGREMTSLGRRIGKKIAILIFALVIVGLVGGVYLVGQKVESYITGIIAEAPDIKEIDATPSGYMSTVLDANGNVTAELVGEGANRVYVTIDEIPINLQHAFVAIEDERFYEHNGIDLKGIARAGAIAITTGHLREGASTITQQLLKNNVFDGWTEEKTDKERITRKIQEQYLALALEREVSKEWIMENYLNTINLGQNTLGVQAASRRYFGKDTSELTLSECAVIASITQNPSKYNPISHPEENEKRRKTVLDHMLEHEFITKEEYDEALADPVYDRITLTNTEYEEEATTNVTSYFVDAVTEQVLKDLQKDLGYSEAEALKAIYSGGLTIYTTQDPDIQEKCDEAINKDSNYDIAKQVSFSYALSVQQSDGSVVNYGDYTMKAWLKEEKGKKSLNFSSEEKAQEYIDEYREAVLQPGDKILGEKVTFTVQPQASMTVIDNSNGQVKALVGGRGVKTASKTLNRASDTTRQPGSTFKIITTYSPALDAGIVGLGTAFKDEAITYANGKTVRNADGQYRGMTTIREAIKKSINVIAIKTSREVTIEKCYESALNYGITTLSEDDIVEALPLGGVTNGVTNLELTAAYATIANGGVYREPILYTKILDHDGNVLLENKQESHTVIKDTTAYLLTSAMQDVVRSGTGTLAAFRGMSAAGKTGTTTSARDAWFAGFTPYYTCAVWSGYDDNTELESTRQTRNIWRTAMSEIHEGLSDPGFKQPDGLKRYTVCRSSGLLAGEMCTETYSEYFAADTAPKKRCSAHVKVKICKESEKLAGEFCPEESVEERTFAKDSKDIPKDPCDIHTKEWKEAKDAEEKAKAEAEAAAAAAAAAEAAAQQATQQTTQQTTGGTTPQPQTPAQ